MKNELVYFLTVFYLDKNIREKNTDNDLLGKMPYTRKMCWGFFFEEEKALKYVLNNISDIYEDGYFNLALIEPHMQGIANDQIDLCKWFDVEYIPEKFKYNITPIDKPKCLNGYCNFSLG